MELEIIEAPLEAINPDAWYKPKDIAKRNFISRGSFNSSYMAILKLIRSGELKHRVVGGKGYREYYQVQGIDIIEYRKNQKREGV